MHEFLQTLKREHQEAKKALEQLQDAESAQDRERQFSEIKRMLIPHLEGEEKFFYSALTEHKEARKDTFESLEEHNVVEFVLNEMDNTPKGEERWGAKAQVLQELVEHHVEEEESKIFPDATKALKPDQMSDILRKYQEQKQKMITGMSHGHAAASHQTSKAASAGRINLNSADVHQLTNVPGIGNSVAHSIINYRNEHGPFGSWDDVIKVSGVTERTVEEMQHRGVTLG